MGDRCYEFNGFKVEVTKGMVKVLPLVKSNPNGQGL